MLKTKPGAPIVITVSLDPCSNPPVTVNPPVRETEGPAKIIWRIASDSPVQSFYFFQESLDFATGSGFIDKRIQDHRCSVFNTWTLKGDVVYVLVVEHEGNYYSTGKVKLHGGGRPCIRNR